MDRQQELVINQVQEYDVRYLRLWFTDIAGTLKSVVIAPAELESAFKEGIGFDGSAIEGLTRIHEADMILRPDATTFQILPWRGSAEGGVTARMFCQLLMPDATVAIADPRNILQRAVKKAADLGFTCYVHPEIEFYLFSKPLDPFSPPVPVDQGGYFDHVPQISSHNFRRDAIMALEEMGISVEFSHHEGGPGQQEIDLRQTDVLTMADQIQTFKQTIAELALEHQMVASFMPKPFVGKPGSGMHTHFSLFNGEVNAFYDSLGQYQLSRTARQFMAGMLRHAPEITAFTNQHVNSYKRIWAGDEAPAYVCWAHNNRSALLRVPVHKPGKAESVRVEYRALDSAANPYLAYALLLSAGLRGIEQEYVLGDPVDEDVRLISDLERRALEIPSLPGSLHSALELVKGSELVAEVLGEDAFASFLRNKEAEWKQYRQQVTPYEYAQFMPVFS